MIRRQEELPIELKAANHIAQHTTIEWGDLLALFPWDTFLWHNPTLVPILCLFDA